MIWADRWGEMKLNHLHSVDAIHEGDFWMDPENVKRYLQNTRSQYGVMAARQLEQLKINPGSRVLDIGAGSGILAVPLAKAGCKVTVVEQSRLMVEGCEEYRLAENAGQIRYIIKRWEDVTPGELQGPFDVIIASFSLTMADIADAIRKIQAVLSGRVYLFWFLTPPSWALVMQDLWPSLHNKPYYSSPLADCLWNVLYEMEIFANIEVMDPAKPRIFASIDEAVHHLASRLECRDVWQMDILRAYLKEKLIPIDNGEFKYNEGHRSARIWWDSSHV